MLSAMYMIFMSDMYVVLVPPLLSIVASMYCCTVVLLASSRIVLQSIIYNKSTTISA